MSPIPYNLLSMDRMQAASSLLQLGTSNFSTLSPITIETSEPDFSKAIASVLWTRHHGQPSCTVFNCGIENCPLCPAGKPATYAPAVTLGKQPTANEGAKASRKSSVVNWLVTPSSSSPVSRNHLPSYGKKPFTRWFMDPSTPSSSNVSSISVGKDDCSAKRRRVESDDPDDRSSVSSISPGATAGDPEQFPFACHFCPKRFAQACNCISHLRTHTGDRPFACPSCPKSFSQRTSLRTHLRTHTGARPYRCVDCDQRFGDLSTLTKHRRIHTGEKPYRCLHEGCGRAFAQSGNLKRHYRTHALDKMLQIVE